MAPKSHSPSDIRLRLENAVLRSVIWCLHRIPYKSRLATMGWIARRIIGPLAGYKKRALDNLTKIYPDMPAQDRQRIANSALEGFGRSLIENYSQRDFRRVIETLSLEGPGLAAAKEAQAQGRSVIFSSGHYSNHDATRTALDQAGFTIGALYRPMKNPYVNAHYKETLEKVSGPVFAQGNEGTRAFLKHLKAGGHAFLLHDVHFARGAPLPFLGHDAMTSFSAAELALRFNAVLIPYFSTRQPDGVTFKLELEAPIPHDRPEVMMRQLVDLLEQRIERDPGQYFWIHRRWKI